MFLIGVYYMNELLEANTSTTKKLHFSGRHGMTFCKNQLQAHFCHKLYFILPFE